jgi:hypothetical protein
MHEVDNDCFLCKPDDKLVFLRGNNFQAMLGIGPIVEGYTVLSTMDHVRSMFDLTSNRIEEYLNFRRRVINKLLSLYGAVIITEHGRVPNCDFYDLKREPHCYHAHQLLFPVDIDLKDDMYEAFNGKVSNYESFIQAYSSCHSINEYAYFEYTDGACYVAQDAQYPRQYFRMLVAEKINHPERIDWRNWQGWDLIADAKSKLKDVM